MSCKNKNRIWIPETLLKEDSMIRLYRDEKADLGPGFLLYCGHGNGFNVEGLGGRTQRVGVLDPEHCLRHKRARLTLALVSSSTAATGTAFMSKGWVAGPSV